MNNFFPLIENINNYYPLISLLDNFNSYYSIIAIVILYLLYYFISNSFMIMILIFIGILIGFYIVYLMRDTIPHIYKMIPS
jgi:hypothetical protein